MISAKSPVIATKVSGVKKPDWGVARLNGVSSRLGGGACEEGAIFSRCTEDDSGKDESI